MKPRTAYLLAALTALAAAAVLTGVRPLMILGGLPLALLLPGIALSALLFRRPERLVTIERLMLVPVLSLGTLALGGLLAWVAHAPLHRLTWLTLSAGVTLAGLAAVALRSPAATPASAASSVRGRARLPTTGDATLILPVFLDREGLFEPDPMTGRRRLLRQVLPAGLAALMLAGAVSLSLVSSIRTHHVTMTTLSVVPPTPADASGKRAIQVNATGLTTGPSAYRLVVTTAKGTGDTTLAITPDDHGLWTSTLQLPGNDRLTLNLYQTGTAAALRTVIVANAATG